MDTGLKSGLIRLTDASDAELNASSISMEDTIIKELVSKCYEYANYALGYTTLRVDGVDEGTVTTVTNHFTSNGFIASYEELDNGFIIRVEWKE